MQAVKLLAVRFHFAQYARARIALRLPFRARFTQRFGSVFGFHRQTQWRTQRRQPLALRGGVTGEALAFARQMRAFLTQCGGAFAQSGLFVPGGFQLGLRGADGVVLRRRGRVGDKRMFARAAQRAGFAGGELGALFFQTGDALAQGVLGAAGFQRFFARGDEFFLRGDLRR